MNSGILVEFGRVDDQKMIHDHICNGSRGYGFIFFDKKKSTSMIYRENRAALDGKCKLWGMPFCFARSCIIFLFLQKGGMMMKHRGTGFSLSLVGEVSAAPADAWIPPTSLCSHLNAI